MCCTQNYEKTNNLKFIYLLTYIRFFKTWSDKEVGRTFLKNRCINRVVDIELVAHFKLKIRKKIKVYEICKLEELFWKVDASINQCTLR